MGPIESGLVEAARERKIRLWQPKTERGVCEGAFVPEPGDKQVSTPDITGLGEWLFAYSELISFLVDPDAIPRIPTMSQRAKEVATIHGCKVKEIRGDTRYAPIVLARHHFFWVARSDGRSLHQIGDWCGGRDHTTVMHGTRRIQRLIDAGEFIP